MAAPPLSAIYEDAFVNPEAMGRELEKLRSTVERARALFDQGQFEGALGRARLRRRLGDRSPFKRPTEGQVRIRLTHAISAAGCEASTIHPL
jgi:hypothetical protein